MTPANRRPADTLAFEASGLADAWAAIREEAAKMKGERTPEIRLSSLNAPKDGPTDAGTEL